MLRTWLIWLVALVLFAAALWFFHGGSQFLVDADYLGGLLHILMGLATIRAGVEMARLAVVSSHDGS